MKLNIELSSCIGLNCFTGLVVTTMEWLNIDYQISFFHSWEFQYKYNIQENYMELLTQGTLDLDLLEEYSGVKIIENEYNDNKTFLNTLKKELEEGKPLIVMVDKFWCPWSVDYQKVHKVNHAALVYGYNKDSLICMDYSPREEECFLPYEYISNAIISYYCFEKVPFKEINTLDLVRESIQELKEKNIFQAIREFGNHIKDSFDPAIDVEKVPEGIGVMPKIWEINKIARGRIHFADALKAISKKMNITYFNDIIEDMGLTLTKWSTVSMLLSKLYITDDNSIKARLANRIFDLADFEESIFNQLCLRIDTPIDPRIQNTKRCKTEHDGICINLEPYFNNRAFENEKNRKYKADFTGLDSFILKNDFICGRIIKYNTYQFELAHITNDVYDNIQCNGQIIELPKKEVKKIIFLGCSTQGSYSKQMTVYGENNTSEQIELMFADSYYPVAEFVQDIVWSAQCSVDYEKKGVAYDCHFYACECEIKELHTIQSIKLPMCMNMHIFAITLQ